MTRMIRSIVDPIARRIKLAIGRAVLTAVLDTGKRQFINMQALNTELKDNVQRVQQYGTTSNPLPGAEIVFVCIGGNRDHPIVISTDDPRYRLNNLQPGEVAVYQANGDSIILKNGNNVIINTQTLTVNATTKVQMNTPILECTGDIIDQAATNAKTLANMRTVYDGHTHNVTSSVSDAPNQGM